MCDDQELPKLHYDNTDGFTGCAGCAGSPSHALPRTTNRQAGLEEQTQAELPQAQAANAAANESASQTQFVEKLLDVCNNRRDAIDLRATVIATIGLALVGFLLTQSAAAFRDVPTVVRNVVALGILIPTIASLMHCLRLITPLKDSSTESENAAASITYLYHIPDQAIGDYISKIQSLRSVDVVEATAKHVFDLSKVIRERYDILQSACRYLYLALALLFASVISEYVWLIVRKG